MQKERKKKHLIRQADRAIKSGHESEVNDRKQNLNACVSVCSYNFWVAEEQDSEECDDTCTLSFQLVSL